MKNRVVASLLILTFTLSACVVLSQTAATPPVAPDWQALGDLEAGKTILVEMKDGRTLELKFIGIHEDELTVSDVDSLTSGHFKQKDIERVYLATSRGSRQKRGKIGAIIGGILGLVIASPISVKIDDSPARSGKDSVGMAVGMGMGLGGAAAGYGIGYALGGTRKRKLLYESK